MHHFQIGSNNAILLSVTLILYPLLSIAACSKLNLLCIVHKGAKLGQEQIEQVLF